MQKLPFIFLWLISLTLTDAHAQDVQWASEVVKFSSQYGGKSNSANQVLGKPNVVPAYGSSPVAWAPATEKSKREYLQVRFAQPMHVRQVVICENMNPGSVHKIFLIDTKGREYLIYEDKNNLPEFTPYQIFRKKIPLTDYLVKDVRVEFRMDEIGICQIDAIGISQSELPVQVHINEIDYEDYDEYPENLGPMVNSGYDDMLPIISPDGKTLFFGRKKHPHNEGDDKADDIWYSTLNSAGKWSPALNIGNPLNNKYHNYVCAVMPDGSLVLANQYNKAGIPAEGVSISHKTNKGYSYPKNLVIKNFYNKNEFSNYHMSVDGRVLLMVIERDDTYGNMDIYVSFKTNADEWTEPMNIGSQINTAGAEASVFLAADGRTIYFSSEGYAGYGSFDMYMSRRLDASWTKWSEPVNLGSKINSRLRDVYYTVPASGDYIYFSSDKNSFGMADLYRLKLPREIQPEPVALLQGKVIDALTNQPIDAELSYTIIDKGENINITSNPVDGDYQVVLPYGSDYQLSPKAEGYYPESKKVGLSDEVDEELFLDYDETDDAETVKREVMTEMQKEIIEAMPKKSITKLRNDQKEQLEKRMLDKSKALFEEKANELKNDEEKERLAREIEKEVKEKMAEQQKEEQYTEVNEDIKMVPLKEGQIIRINNIYFEANKAFLRSESHTELNKVVDFLNENPTIRIEIGGHTNGLPSHEFCDELSTNRAETVTKYLISNGIDPTRITYKGYGKNNPIADNGTLAGRKMNQRVELKIISLK